MDDDDPPDGGGTTAPQRLGQKRPAESELMNEPKKINPPSTSIQSVYTVPGFEDTKLCYSDNDAGPFTVHVVRIESDPAAGLSIKLLKFAQFLHKNSIKGLSDGGIKSIGRNRISVQFKSANFANSFVDNPLLKNNNYSAIIPKFQVSRCGVVRDIPTDWSLEDLISGLSYPSKCGKVIKARRLNVKIKKDQEVTWVPSKSVVLTFAGQTLPEKIYCYNTALPVAVYQLPTIQCRNCCRFGHVRAQCRSKPRCYRCAQPHSGDTCTIEENKTTCFLCNGGQHKAVDPNCPEHMRQKAIKIVMSENNISYTEASLRFPVSRKSYAEVAVSSPSQFLPSQSTPPDRPSTSPPVQTAPSPKISYKKTITKNPRSRISYGKSYDIFSHNEIVKSPTSSQPNGCALNDTDPTPYATPNDNLIELLTCSLINIISKFSDALPNNVIILLEEFLSKLIAKNGSENSSMEL